MAKALEHLVHRAAETVDAKVRRPWSLYDAAAVRRLAAALAQLGARWSRPEPGPTENLDSGA